MKGCLAKQTDLSGFWNPQMCFSFRARSQGVVQVSSAWLGQTLKLNLRQTFPGITFFSFCWNLFWFWFGLDSLDFWFVFQVGILIPMPRVHFWPIPEALMNGMLSSLASALYKRISSMNSVTNPTLSLAELISLSQKWTEFRKYSSVTTDMFHGWIIPVAVLREASVWRTSLTVLNSRLNESKSLSFKVLAALRASGDNLVIEMSLLPGLWSRAQIWLFMCPLRPTPSVSYLEIGSRPEIPIDSRACSQIS